MIAKAALVGAEHSKFPGGEQLVPPFYSLTPSASHATSPDVRSIFIRQ
jgi:hypothetical protein